MSLVASASFCWSVGAWTVTQRELTALRGAFASHAKESLRVSRYWSDTDAAYHRRRNQVLKRIMEETVLAHLDVYVLKRMYDYAGHIQRAVADNSSQQCRIYLSGGTSQCS